MIALLAWAVAAATAATVLEDLDYANRPRATACFVDIPDHLPRCSDVLCAGLMVGAVAESWSRTLGDPYGELKCVARDGTCGCVAPARTPGVASFWRLKRTSA